MPKLTFTSQLFNPLTDEPYEVEVECEVQVEHDPYGTGDSPTMYEVHDLNVTNVYGTHVTTTIREDEYLANLAIDKFTTQD